MSTALALRSTVDNGIGSTYLDMITTYGAGSTTCVVNTVASGTEIQWTVTGGGAVRQWVSGRVPSGGFTLAGQMTFSIWAQESNMSANCGIRVRVFKRTSGGVETEISSGWAYGSPSEISSTGATEYVWNGTPASTAFAENDRILIKVYIINVGTMAGGHTCTLTYNAASGSTGDSLFTINETVAFKAEAIEGSGNLTYVHALASTGTEQFIGSGNITYLFTLASIGTEQFIGAGNLTYTCSLASQGIEQFIGTGDLTYLLNLASLGEIVNPISGTGNLSYLHALSSTGVETIIGTGGLVYPISLSSSGIETINGSGGLSYLHSLSSTGIESFLATASLTYLFSLLANGTSGSTAIEGSGGLAYQHSLSGIGVASGAVIGAGNFTFYFYFSSLGGVGKVYYNLSELKYIRRFLNDPTRVGM